MSYNEVYLISQASSKQTATIPIYLGRAISKVLDYSIAMTYLLRSLIFPESGTPAGQAALEKA